MITAALNSLKNLSARIFAQGANRQRVFANSVWLFAEKILRMGLSFFVTAWMIRYLGPQDFGLLSYALAFTTFFEPLASLGLPAIVKKQLVVDQEQGRQERYLGTVWGLLLGGGVFCFCLMNLLAIVIHPEEKQTHLLVLISSLTFLIRPFDVIEMFFDSQMKSRPIVKVKLVSMLLGSMLKVLCIVLKLNLYFFLATFLMELVFAVIGAVLCYRHHHQSLRNWRFEENLGKELLRKSWPIIFSGLTITIYMKIDQLMLKYFLGAAAVGTYSAAVKLSEMWYFIPMTLSVSFFPLIMTAHQQSTQDFERKMQKTFTAMTWLFLLLGLPFIVFSKHIVLFLFHERYLPSVPILQLHFWTGIFVFWGVAQGIWDIAQSTVKYSSLRTLVGALCNVGLNCYLIPHYGGMGAALATVCAQAITNCVMNLFYAPTRKIFWFQLRSFDPRTLEIL